MASRRDVTRVAQLAAGALLASVVACGDLLDIDDDPPSPPPAAAPTATAQGEAGAGTSPEGGAPLPPCATYVMRLDALADTIAIPGNCHGAISYGGAPGLNVGVGRLLLRFDTAEASAALRENRIRAARLILVENPTCDGSCNVPRQKGRLVAHIVRSDWTEGEKGDDYHGADNCRRTSTRDGAGWGDAKLAGPGTAIATPADYGAPIGEAEVRDPPDQSNAIVEIEGKALASEWRTYAARSKSDTELALFVEATAGRFVVRSKESRSRGTAAVLELDICPTD